MARKQKKTDSDKVFELYGVDLDAKIIGKFGPDGLTIQMSGKVKSPVLVPDYSPEATAAYMHAPWTGSGVVVQQPYGWPSMIIEANGIGLAVINLN